MRRIISFILAIGMLCLFFGSAIPTEAGAAFAAERRDEPKNPLHHCTMKDDGTDTAEWSYIYFGSYPQSEVTGNALTAEIISASYDENGDAWVNGTKYRRVREWDEYEENPDGRFLYFKWEQIRWRVLKNDGNTLFVSSDVGLECRSFHNTDDAVAWEDCSMRQWLNNDFYRMAFDTDEQKAIEEQPIAAEDKIFLLSLSEVTNPDYGFCEDGFVDSASRRVKASDYIAAKGAWLYADTDSDEDRYCLWQLRTPGSYLDYPAYVLPPGSINGDGDYIDDGDGRPACVPALYLKLSSDAWSFGDNESGNQTGTQDGRTAPKNPLHHCTMKDDGTDTTEWSYIYFGSYPQSEVTGNALSAEIINASYDENGDAWVNKTRYRRLHKRDTNADYYFGDNGYRYFKWEPMKWRVLQNNGSTLFLMADEGIDCKDYHETDSLITWEECTLRNWLNNDFFQTAFDRDEQEAVVRQYIANEDNPEYETEGGNNTEDCVFLLSLSEIRNPDYGFCSGRSTYSVGRRVHTTDYANARGANSCDSSYEGYSENCWWWLRTPGNRENCASYIDYTGYLNWDGVGVFHDINACVPALHIDLNSNLWTAADDGTGGTDPGDKDPGDEDPGDEDPGDQDPGNEDPKDPDTDDRILPTNPMHHCTMQNDGSDKTDFSYIYFGSYPQSESAGGALTEAVIGGSYDTNGDAWVNGTKYRRISKSDTNSSANFGDSKYRYFKWEPIKWRVLQNDGDTLFVMADMGLDCKRYNDTYSSEDIHWENSSLRKWLGDDFYQTAFDSAQQAAISDEYPYYDAGDGDHVRDKVSLLSIKEALNPEYGFCQNINTKSVSRMVQVSDYANARGADRSTDTAYKGNSLWWIFTSDDAYDVAFANSDGIVYQSMAFSNDYTVSVVPVLYIDISSDLWSIAENGGGTEDQDPGDEDPEVPETPTDLKELRAQAMAELNDYKTFSDYRKAQWEELLAIIAAGEAAIGAAEDEASITQALFAAKAEMDRVKTDAQLTEEENSNSGNREEKPGGSQTVPKVTAPKAISIQGKIKAKKRSFLVKWKSQPSASGYQVQYSSGRKFTKKTTKIKTLIGASKVKATIKGLKSKKKYYVRIRVMRIADGTPYYSSWSKVKTVVIK